MREPSKCLRCPHRRWHRRPTTNLPRTKTLVGVQSLPWRVNLASEVFLATAVVHYTAAAVTDRGRKRPSNEDAFGFSVEAGVYVVCDGMGGAAAGEVASSLAVDEVLRMVTHRGDDDQIPLVTAAEKAINAANEAIYSRAQRNQRLSGMGTTLVVMAAKESHVWVLNIGDSRCYRYRQGRLEQLTLEHSLVE